MNKTLFPFLLIITVLTTLSPVHGFEGPFQLSNAYPLFLHADQQHLESAAIESSLSFSLSHSSTYTVESSGDWDVNLDMEITQMTFRYRRIIQDLVEVGLDVPLLYFGGGILDAPLADYHDTFGFGDYGRSNRPHNEFLYEVRREGRLVVQGESGLALGDIRLALKKPLLEQDGSVLTLRGDVEFPVSDAEKGYSNGAIDFGAALLYDWRFSDATATYLNLGVVFPGDVEGHEDVELDTFLYGGVAVEMHWWSNFSFLVQLHGQSELYPDTGISAIDGRAYMIAFGGRCYGDASVLDFSLTEDLNTTGAPDFIINLTYKLLL